MKLSGTHKIRIAITAALLFLFVFANLYAVRRMGRYGAELYFYDKLLVAYREGGGIAGLKNELNRVLARDKMPHELATARDFKKNLDKIKAPEEFLEEAVKERKDKIARLKNLRIIAFLFILFIILLRLAVNFYERKDK
ncbi:MAG: hypothetical protein V1925_00345 [Candidatus Omnitrophota bacterium]